MIKVKSHIHFVENPLGRTWPIKTGYRPAFKFIDKSYTSGIIERTDRDILHPGENAVITIYLLSKKYLGDNFGIGKQFTFSEGSILVGTGEIIEIIEFEEN